jgi:prevent-host-death family protein
VDGVQAGGRRQPAPAKQQFSEVIRAAQAGEPQIVTKHSEEVAVVVIDIAEFRRLRGDEPPFAEWLLGGPKIDYDPDELIDRSRERPREIDFGVD